MMQVLSWQSIGFYYLFGVFSFYPQLHAKHFQGGSQAFGLVLNLSGLAGLLTGLIYLVAYGWFTVWWAPLAILAFGVSASGIVGFAMERAVGRLPISVAGFVGWPASAYYMFKYIPGA